MRAGVRHRDGAGDPIGPPRIDDDDLRRLHDVHEEEVLFGSVDGPARAAAHGNLRPLSALREIDHGQRLGARAAGAPHSRKHSCRRYRKAGHWAARDVELAHRGFGTARRCDRAPRFGREDGCASSSTAGRRRPADRAPIELRRLAGSKTATASLAGGRRDVPLAAWTRQDRSRLPWCSATRRGRPDAMVKPSS